MRIKLTVLVEDTATQTNLFAEHGLSVLIETRYRKILFDTGQGGVIEHNAAELGIDLSCVDTVVLSHGHYDHAGGLGKIVSASPDVEVYCHPKAFLSRYVEITEDDGSRMLKKAGAYKAGLSMDKIKYISSPTEITPGIFLTGEVPRKTDYERVSLKFRRGENGSEHDTIPDDMSMWFRIEGGVAVLSGCAHSGIVNTVSYIRELSDTKPVVVIGGFHLWNASENRLKTTVTELKKLGTERIVAGHCTGDDALNLFRNSFRMTRLTSGLVLNFNN